MGHKAIACQTLAKSLEIASSEAVDAIFLDIRLPDGNGLALLPTINQLPSHPKVIIITGAGDPDGAELAIINGVPGHLIDGAADIDPNWFSASDTVLITAGASAPESVVQECVEYLKERFDATVEVRSIRDEEVHFPLPRELRSLEPST